MGQQPDAPLTALGHAQAGDLADLLCRCGVTRIVSSPFARAVQSIVPLSDRIGIPIETDERLQERVLCGGSLLGWREQLRATFDDLDLCLPGGESSRAAMARGRSAVDDLLPSATGAIVVVTHGNLLTLLLKSFDPRVGYAEWERLTNPDVYRVQVAGDDTAVERVWPH